MESLRKKAYRKVKELNDMASKDIEPKDAPRKLGISAGKFRVLKHNKKYYDSAMEDAESIEPTIKGSGMKPKVLKTTKRPPRVYVSSKGRYYIKDGTKKIYIDIPYDPILKQKQIQKQVVNVVLKHPRYYIPLKRRKRTFSNKGRVYFNYPILPGMVASSFGFANTGKNIIGKDMPGRYEPHTLPNFIPRPVLESKVLAKSEVLSNEIPKTIDIEQKSIDKLKIFELVKNGIEILNQPKRIPSFIKLGVLQKQEILHKLKFLYPDYSKELDDISKLNGNLIAPALNQLNIPYKQIYGHIDELSSLLKGEPNSEKIINFIIKKRAPTDLAKFINELEPIPSTEIPKPYTITPKEEELPELFRVPRARTPSKRALELAKEAYPDIDKKMSEEKRLSEIERLKSIANKTREEKIALYYLERNLPAKIAENEDEPIRLNFENKFGEGKYSNWRKGLYDTQIHKIMENKAKRFVPVIMSDEIPTLLPYVSPKTKEFGFIINSTSSKTSGQHWRAVFIDVPNSEIDYYDSLVSQPTKEFLRDIKLLVDKINPNTYMKLKINMIKQQADDTENCGFFACSFLINRFKNKPFKNASGGDKSDIGEYEIEKFKNYL